MNKRSVAYEEILHKELQALAEAQGYLNAALEDEDPQVFLLALKDVLQAHAKMSDNARKANLIRDDFYRVLSSKGNPRLANVRAVLNALGLHLSIQPHQNK
jgi:probable addiction module antidote protein